MVVNNNASFCYKSEKKHHPQTLLEECKNEIKKNKRKILSIMILAQVHMIMKLIVILIMRLK